MNVTVEIAVETGREEIIVRKKINMVLLGGMTGRNEQEVQRHLQDLQKYGIPAPKKIPMIMRVGVKLLTSDTCIEVQGDKTSGEAEYVFFNHEGRTVVTVGSDHSDNELEKTSTKSSKQVGMKVLCPEGWYYDDVREHWDELILRSWIVQGDRQELYQEDNLSALLHIEDLRRTIQERVGAPLDNALIFSGTLPTKRGILAAEGFKVELEDPMLQRRLSHGYVVESFPGYY